MEHTLPTVVTPRHGESGPDHHPQHQRQETSPRGSLPAALAGPRADTISALLGFLPLAHVVRLLEQEYILDLPPREQIYELYDACAEYCDELPAPAPRPGATTTIALLGEDVEERIMRRPTFIREYAPEATYRICLVPVHLLVTPQWYVNLDFVDQLCRRAPQPGDLEGALAFAFNDGVELDDFWSSNGSLAVSTRSVGQPRVNSVEGRRVSPHEVEVIVRIHSRPNYIEVAHIGSRLLVMNGTHRAAALWKAGFDRIPCALTQADSLWEIVPAAGAGMVPEPRLLRHERPPYIADFFDPQVAPRFRQRTTYVIAKVTPQVEILHVQER